MQPHSTQYFLHKLRAIETIKLEVFKEIFSSYEDCLTSGLEYYRVKKVKPTAKEELMKQVGLEEQAADFILELSEALNLDTEQCAELFCAYMLYDYAGLTRDMKAMVSDADTKKILFNDLKDYFRREQVGLLMAIAEILNLVQQPDVRLPYVALLERFVFDKLATSAFVDSLLISLNAVWTKNLDDASSPSGAIPDAAGTARHCFVLQEHIIRVLIWLVYVCELPVDCDVAVLKFFTEQNFGRKQLYKKFLWSNEANERVDRIVKLEMLLSFKLFQLEALLLLHCDESGERDSYWLNGQEAVKVTSILEGAISTSSQDYSGLALAYTLNTQLRRLNLSRDHQLSPEQCVELDSKVQKYGAVARRNGCLKFCNDFLTSPAITDNQEIRSLARAVVYVALDGCLQFFEAESLGSVEDLTSLFCDTLRDESVAEVFWSRNFVNGASNYVLNEIVYQFYGNFERPLQVSCSLASASLESCQKVINLWRKLPVFCEPIEDIEASDVARADVEEEMQEEENGTMVLVVVKERRPFGDGGPILLPDTRGRLVRESGSVKEFVQWEFSYNAWQLCLAETTQPQPNLNRVSTILDLISTVLEMDPSSVSLFVHFIKEAIAVLKKTRYFEADLPISVLEQCFRCLAIAAKTFPYEVLAQLSEDDILPGWKGQPGDFQMSLVSRILNDVERLSGSYDCTVQFVRLIEFCCDQVSCYSLPNFIGSVRFICENVFSSFTSWPYKAKKDMHEIATMSLRICRKILEHWTTSDDSARAAIKEAANICRSALTEGEARRVLIRLACVGLDTLKESWEIGENSSNSEQKTETVSFALALLLELMIDLDATQRNKAQPPQIFLDLFSIAMLTRNTAMGSPISVIGRYLFLRTNDQVPKLAIICLKRIAKKFPATMLSAFGEWASAFCDALLTRLESPTGDIQLKVYCIEFLIVAVQHQPGLAELLLDAVSTQPDVDNWNTANQSNSINNDGGALNCVLSLMSGDRVLPNLATACVNLFATIWRANNSTAMDYLRSKRKEDFWPILLAPLSAGEEDYYLTIVAPIWRILTSEMFEDYATKSKLKSNLEQEQENDTVRIVGTIVNELVNESDWWKLTFKKLQEYCQSRIGWKEKLVVVSAWTEFLQMMFMNNVAGISTSEVVEGSIKLLNTVLISFKDSTDFPVVKAASDLCSLSLKHCIQKHPQQGNQNGIIAQFEPIFCRLNDSAIEEWILQLSSIVLPSCCSIFHSQKLSKQDAEVIPLIFDTLCSLLVKILIQTATLRTRNLLSSSMYPWKKALQSSLDCLALIYASVTSSGEKLVEMTQKHSVLRNLRVLAASLMEAGHFDPALFTSICLIFELAARFPQSLPLIRHSGFLEWIIVDVVVGGKEIICNVDVLAALVAVYISMMETGLHHAVDATATFVASYLDSIVRLLFSLPTNPTSKNVKAVGRVLQLLLLLATYKERWHFEASESQSALIDSVSILCYRLPPYLSKPTALADILAKNDQEAKTDTTMSASASGSAIEAKVHTVQQWLMEIMFLGIQFLLPFSPDLLDACNNPVFDAETYPPLLRLDLNTNLAPDTSTEMETAWRLAEYSKPSLTFGAILLTIHLSVNSLKPVKSASPAVQQTSTPFLAQTGDKSTASALLDSAFYFVLSQAALYLRRGGLLDEWQRALLKRDLATELSQYLSRCGVRMGGGSTPTTPRKSPAATPVTPSAVSPGVGFRTVAGWDLQFLYFVRDFVRDVLQNNE